MGRSPALVRHALRPLLLLRLRLRLLLLLLVLPLAWGRAPRPS
jgi:hypothetical protein